MTEYFRLVVPCDCTEYTQKGIETLGFRDPYYIYNQDRPSPDGAIIRLHSKVNQWLRDSNIQLKAKYPTGYRDALLLFESKQDMVLFKLRWGGKAF